jgi:hypothetical protein
VGATPAVVNAVIDALGAFGVRHLTPLTQEPCGWRWQGEERSAETQR